MYNRHCQRMSVRTRSATFEFWIDIFTKTPFRCLKRRVIQRRSACETPPSNPKVQATTDDCLSQDNNCNVILRLQLATVPKYAF